MCHPPPGAPAATPGISHVAGVLAASARAVIVKPQGGATAEVAVQGVALGTIPAAVSLSFDGKFQC